jgi:hypothetical protein
MYDNPASTFLATQQKVARQPAIVAQLPVCLPVSNLGAHRRFLVTDELPITGILGQRQLASIAYRTRDGCRLLSWYAQPRA